MLLREERMVRFREGKIEGNVHLLPGAKLAKVLVYSPDSETTQVYTRRPHECSVIVVFFYHISDTGGGELEMAQRPYWACKDLMLIVVQNMV